MRSKMWPVDLKKEVKLIVIMIIDYQNMIDGFRQSFK